MTVLKSPASTVLVAKAGGDQREAKDEGNLAPPSPAQPGSPSVATHMSPMTTFTGAILFIIL
jgi:hypothetical protein